MSIYFKSKVVVQSSSSVKKKKRINLGFYLKQKRKKERKKEKSYCRINTMAWNLWLHFILMLWDTVTIRELPCLQITVVLCLFNSIEYYISFSRWNSFSQSKDIHVYNYMWVFLYPVKSLMNMIPYRCGVHNSMH